jgi:predicted Rossmann fold flavoprotein
MQVSHKNTSPDEQRVAVVIGGGAAGFFCAVNAARLNPSLKVIILEKTGRLLSKVKVSGGGRCNFTHACFERDVMARQYPRGEHFVRKIFHQFFTNDIIDWFAKRDVAHKTEADGRIFPVSDSSQSIIDCLLREAAEYGVEIRTKVQISKISLIGDKFLLTHSDGQKITADYVCVATGGNSLGTDSSWLKELGHTIVAPVPSLFTFNLPGNRIRSLMGISLPEVRLKIVGSGRQERGPILITHWGLSGPCVLRLSAFAARDLAENHWQFDLRVNWLPHLNEHILREQLSQLRATHASQKIYQRNNFGLPARFWEFLLQVSGIPEDLRWADLSAKQSQKLAGNLQDWPCGVKGKSVFKEEFVTAGGIHLREIDHRTMMSKIVPNLFFAGEIIDVDGVTGGFNFQNAWSTGFVAAKSIAARVSES